MKRPNAAGSVLQALEPVAKKLAEMEQRALAGQGTAVVQMGCQLADSLREAGRRAIDLLLDQAARAEPTGYPIASAAIESTNKRLVARRCKQGGMIWGETGLEAILALRAAIFNPGAWCRLWPHAAAA